MDVKTVDDLSYHGNDPGAVKFGNFINYYSFHSTTERISKLDKKMFHPPAPGEPLLCLDIGCNTGNLTLELYKYLKSCFPNCDIHILAIDIDPILISRAKEINSIDEITFLPVNIMNSKGNEEIKKYLSLYNKRVFNITFCFSVTMWIHLNNGDNGLLEFLDFIKIISHTIVIEPQPWNCYRNAQKRLKKSGCTFPLYDHLKFRNNISSLIEDILSKISHVKIHESSNSTWKRKVQCYVLRNIEK